MRQTFQRIISYLLRHSVASAAEFYSDITVRLSKKERRELQKHGNISEVVGEALRLYLRNRASRRIVSRLKELQKIAIMRTTIKDDLLLNRADRER